MGVPPSGKNGASFFLDSMPSKGARSMRQLLLQAQAWWDAQRFDQPEWHLAAWPDQKVRHIQLHVAKALGKVVAALDGGCEYSVRHKPNGAGPGRSPARRGHISQPKLINTVREAGMPSASLSRRHPGVPSRVRCRPVVPRGDGASRCASAQLAAYIEPREHGPMSPVASIQEAIQDLDDSAEALATLFCGRSSQRASGTPGSVTGCPAPCVSRRARKRKPRWRRPAAAHERTSP